MLLSETKWDCLCHTFTYLGWRRLIQEISKRMEFQTISENLNPVNPANNKLNKESVRWTKQAQGTPAAPRDASGHEDHVTSREAYSTFQGLIWWIIPLIYLTLKDDRWMQKKPVCARRNAQRWAKGEKRERMGRRQRLLQTGLPATGQPSLFTFLSLKLLPESPGPWLAQRFVTVISTLQS